MKKLLLLLLFPSFLTAQIRLREAARPTYNTLIENGSFAPATTLQTRVDTYQSWKYGWLINFGMNTFHGHWIEQSLETPPPASEFNLGNVDVRQWAIEAAARNVDYAMVTVLNEYGFLLYPSEVPYNMAVESQPNGWSSPSQANPYMVGPGADQNIITKFVYEFRSRGIEPCMYINIAAHHILAGRFTYDGINAGRQLEIAEYYGKVMQELIRKYNIHYFWLDMAGPYNNAAHQIIYDAVKSVDPTAMIIGNVIGEKNFERAPYDIQSTEEYAILNSANDAYKTTQRPLGTGPYYVGQEIVGTPYYQFSQWYYYDDLCPQQPEFSPFDGTTPYVKMVAQPTPDYQFLVDEARAYNKAFLAAILVDRAGVIVQSNLDYLDAIDFNP